MDRQFEAIVVGGGPAGLAGALALKQQGKSVALVTGGRPPVADGRCIALMQHALSFLGDLVPGFADDAVGTPLAAIRIVDATDSLLRAPTVTFKAAELGLPCFGLAIPADRLAGRLRSAAEAAAIPIVDAAATDLHQDEDKASVVCADGSRLNAQLVIGADGARSLIRQKAHIGAETWSYPQTALTFIVKHDRDHDDISTEFHTAEGPFTLVPNGDRESSVVWMVSPVHARRLAELDDAAFALAAERRCQSLLGAFRLARPRGQYPMRGLLAANPTGRRVALVGEAAHVFPPIGAQGLNLGLRDVAALARAAENTTDDLGSETTLARYREARRRDLRLRTIAVDALNRSLLTGFLPVQLARSAGFSLLHAVAPLRRLVMRVGMA